MPSRAPRTPAESATPAHPTNGMDERVHQRHRLGVLTIAAEGEPAEFGYLRDALGLTPGNLSRHLAVLEEARLVMTGKGYPGPPPPTYAQLPPPAPPPPPPPP